MNKKKLVYLLTAVLLMCTACSGFFADPGMLDAVGGGGLGVDPGGGSSNNVTFKNSSSYTINITLYGYEKESRFTLTPGETKKVKEDTFYQFDYDKKNLVTFDYETYTFKDIPITYTASANNSFTTTAINFTFREEVSGLTAGNINITNGTGAVTKGALTGNGKNWSLEITVNTAGNIMVKITKGGIDSETKIVAVGKLGGGSGTNADPYLLTEDVWADGELQSSGEQWYKFTATASTQYIHVNFGTLDDLYIQLYANDKTTAVENQTELYNTTKNTSRSLTVGQVYYIKVTPFGTKSGTYKIGFTKNYQPPTHIILPSNATQLTENIWADGELPTDGEQWFKFTATAGTQYIHVSFDTLNSVYAQVYDSSGSTVGNQSNLSGSTKNISRYLTVDREYYIKVTPYGNSDSGTYKITFNKSNTPPLPSNAIQQAIQLTENTWEDGNLPTNGEQWFKFTATAGTQYIHASFGTLTDLYVQVYNSSGTTVTNRINLFSTTKYTSSSSFSTDQEYYIKVTPYGNSDSGTYKITFNKSNTPPLPSNAIQQAIQLTEDTWEDGNLPTNGEQWFKFIATANTQYIHASFGTLNSSNGLYVQVYEYLTDSSGNVVGDITRMYSSSSSFYRTVSSEHLYLIKVTPYSSSNSGTYKIAFNKSNIPPLPSNAIQLTENTWADGNLPTNGEQWFKFTAKASTQYIHASFGTLDSYLGFYVQVYDSSGSTVGNRINLDSTTKYTSSSSFSTDQEYYIKVTPFSPSSGTYKIVFSTSNTTPPSP